VVQRVVRNDEVKRGFGDGEAFDWCGLARDVGDAARAGVLHEKIDHRLADVDRVHRGNLSREPECELARATSEIQAPHRRRRLRLEEDLIHNLHQARVVSGSVVPTLCPSCPESLLPGDVGRI